MNICVVTSTEKPSTSVHSLDCRWSQWH